MKIVNMLLLLGVTASAQVLLGISACESNLDEDGDGFTADEDCNDADALIYPGAPEQCDGLDNNCNDVADENLPLTAYPDADGDGFGQAGAPPSCSGGASSATNASDCNDGNPSIYPGAPDSTGDGLDKSCDGDDGLAPSVGLSTSTYSKLQLALDAAKAGQTVWVGPGTYAEYGLSMKGKAVKLVASHGLASTVIDGKGLGTVFVFSSGEQSGSVLSGFTITGGQASCFIPSTQTSCRYAGGGIYVDGASPLLTGLKLTQNQAGSSGSGGGIFIWKGNPVLSQLVITGNTASSGGGLESWFAVPTLREVTVEQNTATGGNYSIGGGGIYLYGADAILEKVVVRQNGAGFGGGIYLNYAEAKLTDVLVEQNTSFASDGGGIYLESSVPIFTQVRIHSNQGGGLSLRKSNPVLIHSSVRDNHTTGNGGGFYLYASSPVLKHVRVERNSADGAGGGMYVGGGYPTFEQSVVTGNQAGTNGGGLYLYAALPVFTNSIVAFNNGKLGGNLFQDYIEPTQSVVTSNASLFYNSQFCERDNINPTGTFLTVPPQFLQYEQLDTGESCAEGTSSTCVPASLHLSSGSPAVNAGDSTLTDADGTRSDIGLYGGASGDEGELDQDGLLDYFWPGERSDAPAGFEPALYDCNDLSVGSGC